MSCLFEDVFADDAIKRDDIKLATDFEAHAADGANKKVDFAVEIEGAGSFDRKGLNFAIRNRGIVDLFASEALDIGGDDAFVGKDDLVADGFEDSEDCFAFNQKLVNGGNYLFGGDWGEFEQGIIGKINQVYTS